MLRRISIENFKGIGQRIDVELKPVTLLFGPNSAGKSTILHAIHYAHALLESGDPEVGRTRLGGELDLGGFKTFVHDHDLEAVVMVAFEFDVEAGGVMAVASNFSGQEITNIGLELQVRWSRRLHRPQVHRYAVTINGQAMAEIGCSVDGANIWLTNINRTHPIFGERDEAIDDSVDAVDDFQYGCLPNRSMALPIFGKSLMIDGKERQLPIDLEGRDRAWSQFMSGSSGDVEEAAGYGDGRADGSGSGYGSLGSGRGDGSGYGSLQSDGFGSLGGGALQDQAPEETFMAIVDNVMTNAGLALREQLERFRYVGPIRQAPPRNYNPPMRLDEARWAHGLAAWDTMMLSPNLRDTVSEWLHDDVRLATGYRIELQTYRELDDATFEVLRRAAENYDLDETFLRHTFGLATHDRLKVVDTQKNLELDLCDLGEGIAQVVPVVAAAIGGPMTTASGANETVEIVAIEQPELHIHPRMQVVLGDLFLSFCENHQFLIETHSEHLMLRLLRRIRETSEETLPIGAPSATTDTVAVLYVEQREGEVDVRSLRLTDDGDFRDSWPDGFFAERRGELF